MAPDWSVPPSQRQRSRPGHSLARAWGIVVVAMVLALIPVIAAASPPDPAWIGGIYDAVDGDEIVTLIGDQASSHGVVGYGICQPPRSRLGGHRPALALLPLLHFDVPVLVRPPSTLRPPTAPQGRETHELPWAPLTCLCTVLVSPGIALGADAGDIPGPVPARHGGHKIVIAPGGGDIVAVLEKIPHYPLNFYKTFRCHAIEHTCTRAGGDVVMTTRRSFLVGLGMSSLTPALPVLAGRERSNLPQPSQPSAARLSGGPG